MNQLDLSDRTAVITGGARGIGYGVAKRLLASGARVVLWDQGNDSARETAHELGKGCSAMTVDVSDSAAVDATALETAKQLGGPVQLLVNSAGIAGPNFKTWEYEPDDWQRVMSVNLNGTFHCCRALVPAMRKLNYGRIVNIASIAGKEGNPNASAYSASKAAVIALTKSLGKELAESGINVNCVTPAAVHTPIFDQVTEDHIDYMLSKIPMRRFGMVEEVAALIAWLCTEECSFSTGATFDLSGGRATY